jgi:hypothetical protein
MAAIQPTPVLGGTFGKVVLFFNGPGFGFSESYFLNISNATRDFFVDALEAGSALVSQRKSPVPNTIICAGMRVEMLGFGISRSQLVFQPNWNLGPSARNTPIGPPWVGWLFSERDLSGAIHGQRIFRGWASTDVIGYENKGPSLPLGLPKKVQSLQQQMNAVLGRSGTGSAGGQYTWVIPGYNRVEAGPGPPASSPKLAIFSVTLNAQNRLVFTVTPPDVNIGTNGRILVHVNRSRCVRGISGTHKVISAPIAAGVQTITTASRFCCPGVDLSTVTGEVRNVVPVYYQYGLNTGTVPGSTTTSLNPSPLMAKRTVERKVGKEFFGTRGRVSSRCC